MLTDQRGALKRQHGRGIGNRREGRIIDPAQAVGVVEAAGLADDIGIGRGIGSDDHLGRLPGGGEARRVAEALLLVPGLADGLLHPAHRALDAACILVGRETSEAGIGWQLDIDRHPVGIEPGLVDQFGRGVGNGLEVDIAAEIVLVAQSPSDLDELLHRVVGALDDARGEEQPLDVVAPVEAQREVDHFGRSEARAAHVRALAVNAIMAVEDAVIGQQHLQERDAAAVGRVGMADAHTLGRADALCAAFGIALGGAGRGAGRIVFCRIGKQFQLF